MSASLLVVTQGRMIGNSDQGECWYRSETRIQIGVPHPHRRSELELNTGLSTTKSTSVLKLHLVSCTVPLPAIVCVFFVTGSCGLNYENIVLVPLVLTPAGELKKLLTGPTGLHHQDQKLIYKDKERDSNAFLDIVGVKDRSKMVLIEDPISQEKRLLELRRNAKMEKASKSISDISLEVDRLAGQVTDFQKSL